MKSNLMIRFVVSCGTRRMLTGLALTLALTLPAVAQEADSNGASSGSAESGGRGMLRSRTLGGRARDRRRTVTTAPAATTASTSAASVNSEHPNEGKVTPGGRSIEFSNAELDMVFKVYGELTGKTILKDPGVPSPKITLQPLAGQELTLEEKIQAIETVLQMNGVHLDPYGEKFVRAIPGKEARKEGIPFIMDQKAELPDSTQLVSMLFKFENITAEDAQKALDGLKSGKAPPTIILGRTNQLIITDTTSNMNRIREIITQIDVPDTRAGENIYVVPIKHATAQGIAAVLEKIVQDSKQQQEKNGKKPVSTTQQQPPRPPMFGTNNLLRRNQQQPAAPEGPVTGSVSDAERGVIRGDVLIIAEPETEKIVIKTLPENMAIFERVIAELDIETSAEFEYPVVRLKYADAEEVADMINDLLDDSKSSSSGSKNANEAGNKGGSSDLTHRVTSPSKTAATEDRDKKKILNRTNVPTVLADKRINGLVVKVRSEVKDYLMELISSLDIKLSQVLIETCIIEVTLGDEISTGMDWVQKGRRMQDAKYQRNGEDVYQVWTKSTEENPGRYAGMDLTKSEFEAKYGEDSEKYALSSIAAMLPSVSRNGLLNTVSQGAFGIAGGAEGGVEAYNLAQGITTNLLSKSFSFVFDSDKLGLSAILHASESDSRTKYIASPVIMTLDNKEAVINATAMRYLLKGFTASGNSYSTIAVPDYEQKELGIEIKVTPKINPNGTVMLTCEEKYTQLGVNQTIQYSSGVGGDGALKNVPVPTTITRQMSSDVLLENNQTVVFAGLTDKNITQSETGIPILKNIPWIGKWLFSKTESTEYRTELLVFMTPYVLNDAQSAQAEAIRRKRTMSDPKPWDDGGWSTSPLSDGVSKKEQLRRLKDQWKSEDDERSSRKAIEEEKLKRVKQLRELDDAEQKAWLERYKDELTEAEQKELEEKMLDKESQKELKRLAASVRQRMLEEADDSIAKESANEAEKVRVQEGRQAENVKEGKNENKETK